MLIYSYYFITWSEIVKKKTGQMKEKFYFFSSLPPKVKEKTSPR
ncbi:hypothetical protein HMPREF9396_2160 [Streptococcus sanguinis SK1059]|nr:hypothetical protein HMPREF9396_2160 [Streptococcus sanguinis SK1059]EGQ25675.1 hypothetical protein HMPREF9387_0257 [Streptococcus sanguinis SK340]